MNASGGTCSKSSASTSTLGFQLVYWTTTALCLYMIFWILVFPASALQVHSRWRQELWNMYNQHGNTAKVTSPELVEKYRMEYIVHVTHILPGAVWSSIVPLQFHPGVRENYPKIHKLLGYIFTCISIIMAIGVIIIVSKKLMYENFYPDLPPSSSSSSSFGATPGVLLLTLYFTYTQLVAVYCARQHKFVDHQIWMIRHVASGLWVSLQRIFLTSAAVVMQIVNAPPLTRQQQRSSFGLAAQLAILVTVSIGEYCIYRILHRTPSSKSSTAIRKDM